MTSTAGPAAALPRRSAESGRDVRQGVVRQSGLTSAAALVAVTTGLLLDTVVAARFGAGEESDAFVIGARLPLSLLAMFMVTGNQALVPVISTWPVQYNRQRTSRLVSQLLLAVVLLVAVLAVAMALGSRVLVGALSPGKDAAALDHAAALGRVMVLALPLTAGCEVLRAYLNARSSYVLPALMTSVLNTVAAGIVLVWGSRIEVVPRAYVAGVAAQFVVMSVAAWRKGLRFNPGGLSPGPEVRSALQLCGKPFASSALNPLARAVELFFASFLPSGAPTILHYGNRLISAIGGTVLFRSVIVAIVPRLSRATAEGRTDDVAKLTVLGTVVMWRLSLALTALMVALAGPGARLVFHRGNYSLAAATLLGTTLVVYATSLVGSAVQRSLLAPFFARMDTGTPWRNTIYGVAANMALIWPLMQLLGPGSSRGVIAIAIAYSVSQYVNVAHAWYRLRQDGRAAGRNPLDLRPVRGRLLSSLLFAVLAAGVTAAAAQLVGLYRQDVSVTRLFLGLAGCGTLCVAVLAAGLLLSGGRQALRVGVGPDRPAAAAPGVEPGTAPEAPAAPVRPAGQAPSQTPADYPPARARHSRTP